MQSALSGRIRFQSQIIFLVDNLTEKHHFETSFTAKLAIDEFKANMGTKL